MARKRFTTEQIIGMLREAEVRLAQGQTIGLICKGIGITWLRLDANRGLPVTGTDNVIDLDPLADYPQASQRGIISISKSLIARYS